MTHWPEALRVAPHWRRIAIASDIHLSAQAPQTAALWHAALSSCDADAIVLLGDYFDVWVGDDVLEAPITEDTDGETIAFWQDCARRLREIAQRKPVYWICGNRDFLTGQRLFDACSIQALDDPFTLQWGEHIWLLSHGDAWCTSDAEYIRFRAQVRSEAWQQNFLSQPLAQRLATARALRQASQTRQATMDTISDVDAFVVDQARQATGASGVIHGHTHQGRSFELPQGHPRHVTLDWDACATPPRAQWLELTAQGVSRRNITSNP